MASVVQYGRRRGSSKSAMSSAEEASRTILPPDLRQVTVLNRAEWRRIQDQLNKVNKNKDSMKEAATQREALHLQSKEVVKLWSNTIAGQRQKKLEAKKIREQIEEEKRKLIDIEEAKYREQKRKEALERAQTQLYYQTDRVKRLNRAVLLTEVLKEREAQIELKGKIKRASDDADKDFKNMVKTREDKALKQEQEKESQKKLEREALADTLKKQIMEHEQAREQQKAEVKKDGEEFQRLRELLQWEHKMEEERHAEQKKNLMQTRLEDLNHKDLMRAANAQKQTAEEERRKCLLAVQQKLTTLRKQKETELFREAQDCRERTINELKTKQTVERREESASEEQRFAKAVAENDAKYALRQREEEEKRAAMLRSIAAHRELWRHEKEQMDHMEQQASRDALQAMKDTDKLFSEKQQLVTQRNRDEEKQLQDSNASMMAANIANKHKMRRDEHDFVEKHTEVLGEEENQFQHYAQQVIREAAEAKRNVLPLSKAAQEGFGGGLGPTISGLRPRYLVPVSSGTQIPNYVSGATQNIKRHYKALDIQAGKRRLGFTL